MTDLGNKQAAADFTTAAIDWFAYEEAYRGVRRFELGADFLLDVFVKNHLSPESLARLGRQALAEKTKDTEEALAEAPFKYKQQDIVDGAVAVFNRELEVLDKAQQNLSPVDFGVALTARLLAHAEKDFAEQAQRLREKLDRRYDVKTALANTRASGIDLYFNFVWMDEDGRSRIGKAPQAIQPLVELNDKAWAWAGRQITALNQIAR